MVARLEQVDLAREHQAEGPPARDHTQWLVAGIEEQDGHDRITSTIVGGNAAEERVAASGNRGRALSGAAPGTLGTVHRTPRPVPPAHHRILATSVVVAAMALLAVGCSDGSGDGSALASLRSNARPTASSGTGPDVGPGTDPNSDFCKQLKQLDDDGNLANQDPAAAVEALSKIGDVAPPELQGDFETLAGAVQELSGIDESAPDSVERALTVVTRPEVLAASGRITDAALTECGVVLDPTDETTTTEPGSGGSASGDLDLEDVDAVREDATDATWPDKLTSTSIINDTVVELSADAAAGLTADEAVQACTAVRAALVKKNPKVTITIRGGDSVLARAVEDAPCAA